MTLAFISGVSLLALLAALLLFGYGVGVYTYRRRHSRQRLAGLAGALERLLHREAMEADDSDVFNGRAIALDRRARKLAWLDASGPAEEWCLPLGAVDTCSLITSKDRGAASLSAIFLELQPREGAPLRLYFYREDVDPVREKPSLFRKAKYWKQKINLYRGKSTAALNPSRG